MQKLQRWGEKILETCKMIMSGHAYHAITYYALPYDERKNLYENLGIFYSGLYRATTYQSFSSFDFFFNFVNLESTKVVKLVLDKIS